ncbi:MAG: CocE/NonD family hydrolase [Chloroflexota bacterium]
MDKNYPLPDPKLPEGIRFEKNVMLTMRDGIKVSVDVYRPKAEGKYPALYSTSGYLKGIQTFGGEVSHSIEAGATRFLVENGYVHVIGQARGSGLSQGRYNWYDKEEQKDGVEIIEWIAKQPWCTGNVGMIGDSYFARTQWLIAGLQPPSLKCICPWDGSMDDYRSRHDGGLVFNGFLSGWGADTMFQAVWPGPVEGKEDPTNLFVEVAKNPDDGPFYWERSGYVNADKINVPVLSMVHAGGRLHSKSQLMGWEKIKSPKKLIIMPPCGRMTHVVLARSIPFNNYILRFLDKWLKGKETGIMDEPPVVIFDRVTKKPRFENEYPVARTKWTKFFLRTGKEGPATKAPWGVVSQEQPGKEAPDSYAEPEAIETLMAGKPVLAFSSEPLKEDLRVWGPLSAHIYGSSTSMDTGWFVRVNDISPEGQSTPLSMGVLKASYRKVNAAKSRPGMPYHDYQNPETPEPGKVYLYEFDLIPVFHTFKKGHKIWIQVASNDLEILTTFATMFASDMLPPCENKVYHDAEHPSHLLLPVVSDAPEIKPVPSPLADFVYPMGNTAMKF